MAGEIFMRVNEVAEELGVSVPYAYIEWARPDRAAYRLDAPHSKIAPLLLV